MHDVTTMARSRECAGSGGGCVPAPAGDRLGSVPGRAWRGRAWIRRERRRRRILLRIRQPLLLRIRQPVLLRVLSGRLFRIIWLELSVLRFRLEFPVLWRL